MSIDVSAPTESRVHWWLAAEPLAGADIAWALTRVSGDTPVTGPVDAGVLTGLDSIRSLAESVRPSGNDLWSGPLTDPVRERELAGRLGAVLLPHQLRAGLLDAEPGRPDTVIIAARGWLARVPWDCLALDERGTRLVETARVLGGLAATVHVGRARLPDTAAGGPPLRVVDPGPSMIGGGTTGQPMWKLIYPEGPPDEWRATLQGTERIVPSLGGLTVDRFGALLRSAKPAGKPPGERPSRLTYFGHAQAGTDEAPASAALVFTDAAGDPRLFTAFDWLADPDGHPAPPRVALIGCGSDDSDVAEQSGLPIAAINAGAALVTATRWVLPTDLDPATRPTTALATAVDRAHSAPSPIDALRAWQLERLAAWRKHGELVDTPLLWSSLVSYRAPGRP
jgi:hypothetical protein